MLWCIGLLTGLAALSDLYDGVLFLFFDFLFLDARCCLRVTTPFVASAHVALVEFCSHGVEVSRAVSKDEFHKYIFILFFARPCLYMPVICQNADFSKVISWLLCPAVSLSSSFV